MGIAGLWPFLRKKGYDPALRYSSSVLPIPNQSTIRVDVLGSFYTTIRYAYSSRTISEAHSIVEQEIRKLGDKTVLVLYLDGAPSQEKLPTQVHREGLRKTALVKANHDIQELERRVLGKHKLRRHHFSKINKKLRSAFVWSLDARQAFAEYLRSREWNVVTCETEADIKIAIDCRADDVVVSRDSDMLMYNNIKTVWRPISRDRFLVYDLTRVLAALTLNRAQLTVLGIVSKNDYNRNIPSLGSATNYAIVKDQVTGGIPAMVKKYLADDRVARKNTLKEDFAASQRVFLMMLQTPLEPTAQSNVSAEPIITREALQSKLEDLTRRHAQNQKDLQEMRRASKSHGQNGVKVQRHKSHQKFNRYRTIDSPSKAEVDGCRDAPLPRNRIPPHRPRYSVTHRVQSKPHEPPEAMKQYKWKPYTTVPTDPLCPDIDPMQTKAKPTKTTKSPKPLKEITAETRKSDLLRAMEWEHPLITLDVGTVSSNLDRALGQDSDLISEVNKCIREVVRVAAEVKRLGQSLIGRFIERVLAADSPTPDDRVILGYLCPSVSTRIKAGTASSSTDRRGRSTKPADDEDEDEDEDEQTNDDPRRKKSEQLKFYLMLLNTLYSNNPINDKGTVGKRVQSFLFRAAELGLMLRNDNRAAIKQRTAYPGTPLLRSVAAQLTTEMKKMYRNGSVELEEKLTGMKAKGLVLVDAHTQIDESIPAIENFWRLNKSSKSYRRIVPLTGTEQPFISFSELELIEFLWRNEEVKSRLQNMVLEDHHDKDFSPSIVDLKEYLDQRPPGYLTALLLSNVGRNELRQGPRDYKDSTCLMTLDGIRQHIQTIRAPGFDPQTLLKHHVRLSPTSVKTARYVLRGSIKTDGLRLQLLAFKMNELNSVKYKRLPHDVLPNRLTSTVGGVDYYLTEIRNVVKTPQDVAALWGCAPDQIKILGLDLGQACVLGASALLPESPASEATKTGLVTFHNLAVKQKAVYQPGFKHRRWMEEQKSKDSGTGASISDIETGLPPLRGEEASLANYLQQRESVKEQLDDFYNGNQRFKKHKWDARRAKAAEYHLITDRLLKLVGGSIGTRRDDANKVVIGIGLGKFSSKTRLSSLHETFQSYFVQKARSQGYIVVGVNEYYTSKRCPKCEEFVGQVEIRRLYCSKCKSFMHRDIMAGHNICNAVRGHLSQQQRPEYLQPVDREGRLPWQNWITTEKSKKLVGISKSKGKAVRNGQERTGGQKRRASGQETGRSSKRVAI